MSAPRPTREDLARAFGRYCRALAARDAHALEADDAWRDYHDLCRNADLRDLLHRDEGHAA